MGPGRRARRRRLHRQPAARRATRSSRWSRPPRRPARASSPWSAPATPAPPTSRTCRRRRRPLHERLAALVDGLAERLPATTGAERDGRGRRRDRARAHRPPARADAALDLPDPRRRRPGRPAGAARRGLRRRPGRGAGRPPRAGSPPTPTRPPPRSACGPRSGTFRPPEDRRGGYTITDAPIRPHPVHEKTHQRRRPDPRRPRPGRAVSSSSSWSSPAPPMATRRSKGGTGRAPRQEAQRPAKTKAAGLRRRERRHADLDRAGRRASRSARSSGSTPKSTRRS